MSNRYSCDECDGGIITSHDKETGLQVFTICEACDGRGYFDPTPFFTREAFWVVLLIPNFLLFGGVL